MPDETVLTSNRKEDPMGLLEAWRRSREAMDEEMDERTELAASKALGAVAAVTVPFAVFALAALVVVAPVSAEQREFGLQLLIPAILAVAAATLTVSLRRRRALGARLERAILVRSLWVVARGGRGRRPGGIRVAPRPGRCRGDRGAWSGRRARRHGDPLPSAVASGVSGRSPWARRVTV